MTQQDISLLYHRYQFLGHEFLTWLWYRMDTEKDSRTGGAAADGEDAPLGLTLGNRMVLENRSREGVVESITIRGDDAGLEEGLLALRKGAYVTEMNLQVQIGEQQWRLTLKGESLMVGGLKTPQTAKVEQQQDISGAVIEKLFLCEIALQRIDELFGLFTRIRLSPLWDQTETPSMRNWIEKTATQ